MVPTLMDRPSAQPSHRNQPATLELARADIGFSAAHFSVIAGRPERLHGHNYRVMLRAHGHIGDEGTVLDFHALKDALRAVCAALDERMLLAEQSSTLAVQREGDAFLVRGDQRHYVFPVDDVCLLPVDNTTCECLAAHLLSAVRDRLHAAPVRLALTVEELPGQGATVEELPG